MELPASPLQLLSQPESDYAVGPYGFLMSFNFVLRGLFSLALVAALYRGLGSQARSRAGLVLLVVWAVGAFLLAVFPTDVGPGRPSLSGGVHALVALTAFLCAVVGELLVSLRFAREDRFAALRLPAVVISGLAVPALVAFVVAGFEAEGPGLGGALGNAFGLLKRVFLGLILLWMVVVAFRLRSYAR
jgi:hypothetical membrane protein